MGHGLQAADSPRPPDILADRGDRDVGWMDDRRGSSRCGSLRRVNESGLLIYTTDWCGDCHATKRALTARGIPFTEVDVEADADAAARVEALNGGRRSVPTLVHGSAAASLSRFSLSKLDAFLAEAGLR